MSAVPKKKLCWNCEGNVSRQIETCPYCGVYVHGPEIEENTIWNPSYQPSSKTEEIPSPIYQINQEEEFREEDERVVFENKEDGSSSHLLAQLKKDIFPTLFLMMGSVFFLFGIVLLLFSQNGTLTLQWQASYGYYSLFLALPLIGFGWWFLQQLDQE